MTKLLTRTLATALSAALLWLSPGFGALEAFAQAARASAATGPQATVPVVPVSASPFGVSAGAFAPGSSFQAGLGLQAAPAGLPVSAIPVAAGAAVNAAASNLPSAGVAGVPGAEVPAAAPVSAVAKAAPQAQVKVGAAAASPSAKAEPGKGAAAGKVGRISVGVDEALRAAGPVMSLDAQSARGLGGRLQALLSGERAAGSDGFSGVPSAGAFGSARHQGSLGGGYALGKPAGWDSIHRAVQASDDGPSTPVPPSAAKGGSGGLGGGHRAPFLARLLASGMALAPGFFFALPLLGAGALIPGALIAAASVGLALLPWLGESSPRWLKGAPGAAILLLGGVTALTMPGWGIAAGALVALAGWGFARFSRGSRKQPGAGEQMSAFFGALAATAAAGLMLTSPAGWVALGLKVLSAAFAARLLAELPQWTYEGVGQAARGTYLSVRGVHRVLGSIKRDTVLFDRLARLTERQVKRFGWFSLIWLAGLWIPVLISEAAMFALSVAAGTLLAAVQWPILFGWGALHEVRSKHWALDRYGVIFANWGRESFGLLQGSKVWLFNPVEKRLLALANSKSRPVSLFGGLLVRLAQLAWLGLVLAIAVPGVGALFFRSFWAGAETYDPARHSPSALRLEKDPLPGEKPDEKDDPVGETKEALFPKLIATGVALLPLYFLGLPLVGVGAPVAAILYLAAGLGVAAMPLMPQKTPVWLRVLPGGMLAAAGLLAALAGAAPVVGLIAALAGWGLSQFAAKPADEGRYYWVTDVEYVGAFFGALGAVTALGLSLGGLAGLLPLALKVGGALASALTIYHLPDWFWRGARRALEGFGYSMSKVHKVLNFWSRDTDLRRNLRRFWRGWEEKNGWHWTWLWTTWAPYALMEVYDGLAAFAAGLVLGAVRIPALFAWGAAYKLSPNAAATRFIGGFAKSWLENSEGSKELFDRWVSGLVPGMNRAAESGRPTLVAIAALLAARLVQLAWLARLAVWSPVILFRAILDGLAAMREGPPAQDQSDKLDPSHTL